MVDELRRKIEELDLVAGFGIDAVGSGAKAIDGHGHRSGYGWHHSDHQCNGPSRSVGIGRGYGKPKCRNQLAISSESGGGAIADDSVIAVTLRRLELALVVGALVAGFAAGWLLASRNRATQQDQLRDAFQALAATTPKNSTDEFLKLADQKIGNVHREAAMDLTRRQQELGTLVSPIRDTLVQVDAKLKEVEKTRIDDSASMKSLLNLVGHTQQQLQQETQNLVRALRSPGVRGQWGEVQLRKVVELSGMIEHCDFDSQPTIFTEGGRLRPDMTINLPGGRTIVVDAKAPLEAFLDAQHASEEGIRSGKLADHVRQVKDHVTKLGAKQYWDALPSSPELVVLFLPAEAIYMAALERDAALIDYGVKMNVLIASPLTLIALLRAASFGWNQQRLTINAEEISRLGRALHDSVATIAEHLEDLRKRMDGTFSTFNKVIGSFENNLLVKARRFRDLGAGSAKEIPVIDPLETVARKLDLPTQPGLLDQPETETTSGDRS
jgi:DNA recombination protein RmuC